MEKLVVLYASGDRRTWHYDHVIPFVYESAEATLIDLENAIIAHIKGGEFVSPIPGITRDDFSFRLTKSELQFFSREVIKINKDCYASYNLPEILTLEEWFTEYAQQ